MLSMRCASSIPSATAKALHRCKANATVAEPHKQERAAARHQPETQSLFYSLISLCFHEV